MSYDAATTKALQSAVNAAGYTPLLAIDGVMGPKTQAGVAWLQQTSGYSRTDGVPDDQFLANLGITPGKAGYAGAAQGSAGGLHLPPPGTPKQNVLPPDDPGDGPPLDVKPPPHVSPPAPPPHPAPPLPAPTPVAQHHESPLPAVVGAGAGAGLGFFVAGPLGAALGAVVGGFAGFLLGEKTSSPSMGDEYAFAADRPAAEGAPTTRYFTVPLATLAQQPAKFYRLAPPEIVNALSQWAARAMRLPPNAMGVPLVRLGGGEWEGRRSGRNVTLYGPRFESIFGWGARP